MILRSHLIALNQVKVEILKTTNSLIVRVVSNVGLAVPAPAQSTKPKPKALQMIAAIMTFLAVFALHH